MVFFQGAEKKLKAAKALKEKGDTPEELLRSIKENEAAVAEAQRTVDAWKAIVGEKARREEAAKAEAERIAAEKAEEEARVEAERKAEEERIAKQKAEEKTEEAESDKEEAEKQMDDEEPKPVGSGVFGNIYNQFKGKVKEAFDFLMKHKGGDLLGVFHRKDVGDIDLVWGDENGGLAHILNKHVGEGKSFANVDEAMSHIQNIIETGKNDFEDGDKIVFRKGSELVTVRKNFREGGKKIADKNWVLTAYDKEAADNGNRVTTKVIEGKATPHTASIDKGSKKAEKKQKKQSVFDKAKEIADKEEKKRKAEADKPKQKPLTEAERKDAEEVAGALGYRVEWVDTMAENGTIDADKKVIRIAKDAENPLVQVLGHEVAHGVKRMDGGKFKALQKAAKEVVGEKEWNERIEKKRKLNAYAEGKLAEEVTCDIVGEALNNKDALKRLAESLRGERGILARLRDAVAKMVEYFKNRGDKEGVRRMKAADRLLAEFESALKEDVAPEQVKPEGVDRSVRESEDEPENKRRKDFAERFGVDESYVSDYANGMAQKKTGKAARARRSMERQIYLANAGKTSKLSDIAKSLKPFRAALKEAFGDLDALIDEYRKLFEEERNMMEAARKKAEEEAAARKRHLDELSLLTDGQIDSRYAEALEKGDETEAREMLDEVARRKGYGDENNEYRMQHRAPSNPGYESDEARRNDIENGPDVNLEDIALGYNRQPDDYFTNPRGYGNDTPHGRESTDAVANALSSIRQGGRDVTVKVYRAVPTTMKEGKLRNGDWVTLSRRYAEMHGNHALNGKYRIMEDEVPAKDIWWDGNDVNEFGYDNGEDYKYKNVKNNRKSDDLVTRDDKGNVIPPSKRFNQRKADERYSRMESKALTAEERELRDNLVERMRKGGLDVVTDSEEMQRVIDTENERTRMMGAGSVREHRVYHGSGADFDAFDHSHMGEGEGAQAYGWGTYVTEVEGIGRTYANATAHNYNKALRPLERKRDSIRNSLRIEALELDSARGGLRVAVKAKAKAEENYEEFLKRREEIEEKYGKHSTQYDDYLWNSPYAIAVRAIEHYENKIKERETKLHSLQKDLEETKKQIENIAKEFPRHLYTVEIPDDNGSNYLDWNGHPAESLLKDVGSFLESEGFERVQDSPVRYEKGESTVVLNPNATGADLYAELREALGSDKKASQALAELGCIGIKYPADNMRGGREDGAKNYVIFNENDAKITDHTRFLRTAGGEVYGLVKDGRIYLDPKVATSETAVHEYTHLCGDMLRRKDSEQWSHTVKELKNSVLWEEVKESYPELKTDDEIADEVLSTFSGRRGAERLREEARRVAESEGGVFTKAKAIETLERVKEAIARFWEGVARMFGVNRYRSAEELADMAMRDLLDGVDPRKIGNNEKGIGFSAKQKRALETVTMADKSTNKATAISSADGAKVQNNLEILAESYNNRSNKTKGFITDLSQALNLERHEASHYGTFETQKGKLVTIRVSNHNARVSLFDKNGENDGISIVISNHKNKGLLNDGNAHIIEFFYSKQSLQRADGKPLSDIIRSVSEVLYSGEFKDTTGLAERQEVNGDDVIRFQFIGEKGAAEADHAEDVFANENVDRSVRESRSEKAELTAEERELRDNLVERMRKGGLDVVTDSEEMQRVIDTENERTRNKRSKKSEAARKRDEALYAVDWSTAFVSGKSREEATEIRRERGRKFKEETKELYGRVLSGNFDDVTLRLIDEFIDKSTPNNPYERPISKRLPARALQKMRGGERTGSIDALFSRICESTVGKDGKTLPRAERERAIEEKKKELLKKWAIATGNWHTDVSDFSDGKEPIGSGTDSDVYLSKDGKSVIKVSKGKPYGKRFRPDVDNVALFNTVFPGSRYTIEGYGEIDGKFVRFLKQPFVDFSDSTPLTEGERVAYMEKLGFKPINKENTAFSNGEIVASDLQKSNVVRDRNGNVRVIDADMKLHTKDVGGNYSYPDVETDTTGLAEREEVNAGSVREHRVYHGSGADFDAFDHSHMGEGEGAQAYGWGTYVTEVEGIGRTYAIQNTTKHNDALRALQHDVDAISDQLNRQRDDLKYDEEQLKRANEWRAEAELDYELFKDEAEELKEKYGESSPKYRNHLFNDIYTDEMKRAQSSVKSTEESIQYRKEKIAELEKALKDKQAEIDELPKEFPRHLYTVEIPDDNGSNYLDWNGHPAESLLKDVGSFLESEGFERVQDSPVRYEKGESTVVLNPNATGADLYAELREALGSDKKASQALAELGCIGIKYPADNMRGGREDGAKNYVIFNENDAKITDHTRFLRTAGGEVYGLVKDGRIYLDPKVATSETAVHEYTHLCGDMLRRKDSEQWSHTVKELKNSVLWEEVKESYPELKTDDEIADEVLSTFSGRRGAERLREEARRVAESEGGVFTKAKAIETLERVKEAIARFWEGVARMFGINRYRSAEELADMAMKDLLDSKNPMKDESGMRKRGEVGDEGVKSLKGEEAMVALDNIFEDKKTENMPQKVSSLVKFMELFRKPVRTFLGEVVNVKEEVYNKIIREKRTSISGAVLPTLENADFAIRDTDGSTLYIKRFKSENNDNVYNIAVVNKYGEVEDYVSSVHIKSDNNLRNKITKGAELLLPQERITDGILPRNNPTPTANVTNISEPSKPRFSRKPGESIFDYASRVSEDVDRSVRERVSARDEYEKKVKSKGFQTKEALQNSMLGLQEFMSAIDHASGNKRYIEDIPDFENPILGENRLSSVNKEEMHQVAKTQFKPLMSAVAKLSGNGKESGELYDYMFAKHGLERDAVMRQREAQKEFDKYQKANPKGTKTIGDFVASLEGKDYAGLTALTAEDGRVKSIQSQIDAIDEQMEATDNQLLLHYLGGQKKRLKVDLLNAARDAADDIRKTFESDPNHNLSDINELWSRVNEVNGNTLRKLYESGMLTKEAYNDISSMYTNYIPMRGFDQTTSADAYAYLTHGDSAFNAPIKTAKGRSSKADNPIAYMQAMAESAIMQGNRNVLVKQKMLNFVRNHPSDLASVSDVWLQYDSVADEWKPFYAFGRESKG